jgi:hypothetical protein
MDAIQKKKQIDLIDIVSGLREDRMGMIQHTSQYKFAYQAAVNYAMKLYPEAGIFTTASNSSTEVFGEKLKADSMRKNGAVREF